MSPPSPPSPQTVDEVLADAVGLHRSGRPAEAERLYRLILSTVPDEPLVLLHLALALHAQGKLDEMAAFSRICVAVRPDLAEAHATLGVALHGLGRSDEAIAAYRQAIAIKPDNPESHYNLGNALKALGRFDEAATAFRQAIAIKPSLAEAFANLGATLIEQSKFGDAAAALRQAIGIRPDFAEAHYNLGLALKRMNRFEEAIDAYRRAVAVNPSYALAHNNLGVALKDLGRIDEAVIAFRHAIAADPDYAKAHSTLLFCLCHLDSISPWELAAEHRAFGTHFEAPHKRAWPVHRNPRDPERRLRIGVVSADLYDHVVASFLEPVLAAMDRGQFELYVYANTTRRDTVTARLTPLAARWLDVTELSEEALATQITEDCVDILVDLSGHSEGNRLLTFARKPAPLQVSLIGYPNTTGLTAIDYYIVDKFFSSAAGVSALFTEKLASLTSIGTFQPSTAAPPVNDLPALTGEVFTFGSFSRLTKISETTIALWCRVLRAVPGSRLLLGAIPDNGARRIMAERFSRHGVSESRLLFLPAAPVDVYFARYHLVDLILDTFPYSGSTTSNDATWMGVPTLTLVGMGMPSWGTAVCMCHVGLAEFVVNTEDDFVAKAQQWAQRTEDLATIRRRLRSRFSASPNTDPATGAHDLQSAFRQMWRGWCAGLPAADFAAR